MISNRTRPLDLRACPKCEKQHPATLFNAQGFCVYCAQAKAAEEATQKAEKRVETLADDPLKARRREHLRIRREKKAALARIKAQEAEREARNAELDAAEAARQELARRELCRNHLLPFILRFNDKYEAGWVHKDICDKLEWFSAQVAAGLGPRMMIFMPPRHGKSEIGSRSFPAWHLGRYPHHEFIACSYGSDLANGFSRKVRDVIEDPAYHGVFEDCRVSRDSRAVESWQTTKGGGYTAAGVGGPITGRGAHCFPAGTPVLTEYGQLPIESVQVGMRVFTCDISTGNMSYRPVVASASHATQHRLVEITTASGQRVRATPDHRFYVPTVGWIEAADLRPGDKVILAGNPDTLRRMRQAGGAGSGRGSQVDQQGLPAHSVQQYLRGGDAAQGMSDLRREVRPGQACAEREVLLERLYPQAQHDGAQSLPALHDGVHAAQSQDAVLQPPVRERGSLGADARGWELSLQRRAGLRPLVRFDAATDRREGRWVRGLRDIAGRPYSPHRPRSDEQRGYQLDLFMPDAPHDSPQVCVDTISMVAVAGEPGERVYDIQVEGTHCFFAGNILVHNCLVIDDPIKNREDAESAQKREAVWDWYTSTAYTRLAPGGGILVILTRWHDDDLAGRLLRKMAEGEGDEWVVVEYPAQAVTDELFRKKGEPLHPERYSNEALEQIKRAVGPRDWQALYQQNPTPDEGDYFNKSMFQWYTAQDIPDYSEMNFYTAWDLAIGQNEQNDFSVGITVGVDRHDRTYVVDIQRGHWGTLELVDKMLEVYKTWRPAITGIEKGHIEMTLRPFLDKRIREERLTSFYIEEMNPGRRDKVARARSIQGRMQQGLVYFRKHCNVTAQLVAEMMRFPNGVHDDGVDAMAWIGQMLSLLVRPREQKAPRKQSWKDKLTRIARVHQTGHKNHMSA